MNYLKKSVIWIMAVNLGVSLSVASAIESLPSSPEEQTNGDSPIPSPTFAIPPLAELFEKVPSTLELPVHPLKVSEKYFSHEVRRQLPYIRPQVRLLQTVDGKIFIERPFGEGILGPAGAVDVSEEEIEEILAHSHDPDAIKLYAQCCTQFREKNKLNLRKIPQKLLLKILAREKNINIKFWIEKEDHLEHVKTWLVEDDSALWRHLKLDSQGQLVSLLQRSRKKIMPPSVSDGDMGDIL